MKSKGRKIPAETGGIVILLSHELVGKATSFSERVRHELPVLGKNRYTEFLTLFMQT